MGESSKNKTKQHNTPMRLFSECTSYSKSSDQQDNSVSAGMTRDDGLCRAGQVTKCLELKRLVSTWDAFFNDLQYNKCLSYNLVKIPLSFLQYVLGSFYTLLRNIFKRFSSILYTFPAD